MRKQQSPAALPPCSDQAGPCPVAGHRQASPYAVKARRQARTTLAVGLLLALAACGNGGSGGQESSTTSPSTSSTTSASPSTSASTATTSASTAPSTTAHTTAAPTSTKPTSAQPASCVDRAYNAMTTAQRVGQLFMTTVSSTGITTTQSRAITTGRTGSVFIQTHTNAGTAAVKALTAKVRALASPLKGATGVSLGMLISTDQEGGEVQVLNGPGFSSIPSAVSQGGQSPSTLQADAATWGRQLRAAGVNMNLAPVGDTVPPNLTDVNAPIGKLNREYGTTPSAVASHSTAFLRGMRQAGVVAAIKHFPGLGRVTGNTDFTLGVTDTVTTGTDSFLQPFRAAVQADIPFVMVSSAIYSRIDPHNQAAFSSTVIRKVLRGTLGFKGAVISDDLGNATAVSDRTPAQRAVDYFTAGGNLLLTVQPRDVATMTSAVLNRMPTNAAFRADVADSVHRVLTAKLNAGVLTCK